MDRLGIKDVAEATGIAAGTIRMWEQRYGFPEPERTGAGYRAYSPEDVEAVRSIVAHRSRGLSVAAAIGLARESAEAGEHRSIYAAVASSPHGARPQVLRKGTLVAMSRAIEHETLAQAASPVLFGAFQHERFYREVELRYRRMAQLSDEAVVFADFGQVNRPAGGPVEVPIAPEDKMGNEWAVIVDAPGYAACLLAWEVPGVANPGDRDDLNRRFESLWTLDPRTTRRAARTAARLVTVADPELGGRLEKQLADRPLAHDQPAPTLTALTNRMVAYLEAS